MSNMRSELPSSGRKRGGLLSVGLLIVSCFTGCTLNPCPDDAVLYGKLQAETICYLEGKVKHGPHTKWFVGTESKQFERTYSHDALDGSYTEWYSNGQTKVKTYYTGGKLNGSYEKWFSNGQKRLVARYLDNRRIGTYTEYFKNGKPRLTYAFNELGKPEGKQTRYRMNGYPISEYTYVMGELVGKRFWRENGTLEPVLSQR